MGEKERSETYKADNSVIGDLFEDGKEERTEVHETDKATGRTETYKADNSVMGDLLEDGKGELKEITEKKDAP